MLSLITSEVLPSLRKHGYYVNPAGVIDAKAVKKLSRELSAHLERYLTAEDKRRVAKKHGLTGMDIGSIISGYEVNNAVMNDLQSFALKNKKQEIAAYQPSRMIQVIEELSK
jgi:prophage antirepressor-like protein